MSAPIKNENEPKSLFSVETLTKCLIVFNV